MKMKRLAAFALAGAMVIGTCTTAFAYDTYQGYTEVQDVNDPEDIVTATAHRAAAPLIDMLGANATSGFGMLNGSAPATLSDANDSLGIQIWGTAKNQVRDPYYANYYYNFYAAANNLSQTPNALINDDRSGSPINADPQTTSLSTRPDVVVGVSSNNNPEDMHGYDSQLSIINAGLDENDEDYYAPTLVAYDPRTLDTMITTVYNTAIAIYDAGEYRYGDPRVIADKYEQYVQGIQGYIVKYKSKKTVAIVSGYDSETHTFTAVGQGAAATTSSDRLVECTSKICNNITNSASESVSEATVNNANWIISENAATDASIQALVSAGTITNTNILYSTDRPDTLYGITMNSVENAMGLAFFAAKIYGNDSDATDPLNGWNLMRYFYCVFWHVNDNELISNTGLLYDALNNEFAIQTTINVTNLESKLAEGESYYDANLAN